VGKATLLQALQATKSAGKDPCLYQLRLDTKYYDVDLLVHCHDAHSSSGASPPACLDHLQALVLVIDSSCKRSHEIIMQFYESLHEGEFDIQLLVANKVDSIQQDSSSTPSAWLQDARTWCYSNGFEYVEAAAGNPSVDATLNEDGEQQGAARVLAALQAHMWPSMQPKPRSQHTSTQGAAAPSSLTGSSAPVNGVGSSGSGISSSTSDQGRAVSAADNAQHSSLQQQHKQGQGHEQQQQQVGQAASLSEQPSTTNVDAVPIPKQQNGTPSRPPAAESPAATKERSLQQQQQQQQQGLGASAALDLEDNPFMDADPDDFEQLMRQVMGE
jgi:hypothetical protein